MVLVVVVVVIVIVAVHVATTVVLPAIPRKSRRRIRNKPPIPPTTLIKITAPSNTQQQSVNKGLNRTLSTVDSDGHTKCSSPAARALLDSCPPPLDLCELRAPPEPDLAALPPPTKNRITADITASEIYWRRGCRGTLRDG